jgi:hypothetical protein
MINTAVVILLIAALFGMCAFLLYAEWRRTRGWDEVGETRAFTVDEWLALRSLDD